MKKIILATFLLIVSCSPESNIKPTLDRTNKELQITVIFHENRNSFDAAYRSIKSISANEPIPEQWGFAQWNEWRDREGNSVDLAGGPLTCEIHAFRPKRIDDQAVLTMGHELLHCVYGSYHK